MWWYIACLPGPPWANAYIENPPIDLRMLMGAQAVRMKPDGFLYYQTSIWNSARPIESGPFTDWDPRSFLWFNGDGSWTRCGPGGRPVATQRLENFRDGVEDHAYVDILAGKLKARPDAPWAPRARRLLEVPSSVMISMTNFTHSASDVYAWRNAVAELIEEEE